MDLGVQILNGPPMKYLDPLLTWKVAAAVFSEVASYLTESVREPEVAS